ncbi:MAG: hypothetical protein JXA99_02935 [Candidatus Lokiarchaeota archaeon]|nr:hypothetical protein [Candidatus Lokiarchaeota archaeon]
MINLNIIPELYNTTLTYFFFILSFLMFYIAYKGYKENRYGSSSTLVCAFLFIFFAYYNSIKGLAHYPYNGFMVWWIGIMLIVFLSFSLLISKISKKIDFDKVSNNIKDLSLIKRYIIAMKKESPYREQISIKMELIRKTFHLGGLLFIFAIYGIYMIFPPLAGMVNEGIIYFIKTTEPTYNFLWGDISTYPYAIGDFIAIQYITLFAFIAILVFTIVSELIRILWGPEYSMLNFLTRSVLRNEEYNAVGPQIYLLAGAIFSYILYLEGIVPLNALTAGILIACFSDAAAALVGRGLGKYRINCPRGQKKTVEGFIAGVGSAYLIGVFTVGPIYAIIAAIIFFLLDFFPTYIADNILNPILITLGITIFYYVFNLPIGFL